jgi:phospholipase/carboxylesterase
MTMLDGPRLAPRSGAPAKSLVVFLHGYGADGNDLIDIGRAWQPALPDTAFVSPHAPEPCAGAPHGRQWFPLTFRVPGERWRGVESARPALDAFLDAELTRHGLGAERLALVGFSQGTMMALHAGLRRRAAPAAILGYSGLLVTPEGEAPEAMKDAVTAAPPVLLVHGDADQVVPPEALMFSVQGLGGLGVPVEFHMSRGLGHGIDGDGLALGGAFLAKALAA